MWGSASAGIDISLLTQEMVFASIKLKPFRAFINIIITLETSNFKATDSQLFSCVIFLSSEKFNLFLYATSLISLPYSMQYIAQSIESQFASNPLKAA